MHLIDPLAVVLLICTQAIHMIRLELTMGRSIPDAGTVSEDMFTQFVKSDIMPHLEYGTILDAVGFWKGEQEQTKILYVEIPESDLPEMQPIFEMIGAAYKKAFRQDAVLISQLQTNAIFKWAFVTGHHQTNATADWFHFQPMLKRWTCWHFIRVQVSGAS